MSSSPVSAHVADPVLSTTNVSTTVLPTPVRTYSCSSTVLEFHYLLVRKVINSVGSFFPPLRIRAVQVFTFSHLNRTYNRKMNPAPKYTAPKIQPSGLRRFTGSLRSLVSQRSEYHSYLLNTLVFTVSGTPEHPFTNQTKIH